MKHRSTIAGALALTLAFSGFAALDPDTVRARVSANLDRIENFRADAVVSINTG